MKNQNVIIRVDRDSIAEELGIEPGDVLLDINNTQVKDVFDYRYLIQDEYIELGIRKPDGEEWLLEIEKDEYEDIGITFERGLMDRAKSCSNKCIFCFIDQLPKGMRENLYFKDDDSRLSFLQGNYVTLTNMKKADLERIIFYHLSPINVSVHTTDPQLRKYMLKNPNAVNLKEYLDLLAQNHIELNFQIVLCKDVNDGDYLDKSIEDLSKYIPHARSLSIVPLGKTKFRQGLCPLELFDKEGAGKVVSQVEKWQKHFLEKYGTRFCYISDEFYLTAELPLPDNDFYEGYAQLENGVGMLTLMEYEFNAALKEVKADSKKREISIATGEISYDFIKGLCDQITEKFKNTTIYVYPIRNNFFGDTITVSGLMTGRDIIAQLKDKQLGELLYIPENAVRTNDGALIDDVDIKKIEEELNTKVVISDNNGEKFLYGIIGGTDNG